MTNEYEQIREGLIALMCVGSTVNYIVNTPSGKITRECEVLSVREKDFVIQKPGYPSYLYCTFQYKALEHFNGELFIWEDLQCSREEKLAKIAKVSKYRNRILLNEYVDV
jgi:hypothetical protein